MQCPNCGSEVREGAAFCESCGAATGPGATGDMSTRPLPQQPMPEDAAAAAAAADYARQQAEYERQKAAYDQQQAAYQQAQYAQQQAAYQQQVASAQPPGQPKKSKAGCFIALAVVLVLLLVGCGVGGYFAYKAWQSGIEDVIESPDSFGDVFEDDSSDDEGLVGYTSADEAVAAELDSSGTSDWVWELIDAGDGYATYWAGPPNSEYVDEIYVEQNADGTWMVLDVYDIGGDDYSTDAQSEAMMCVYDYLTAVYEDRGMDAQTYTVPPFSDDSASAQVSAGGLTYYETASAEEQSDGTFWVRSIETWYGEDVSWEYYVVPTEAGFRISDIRFVE